MRTQLGAVVAAAETHGRRTNESAALATAIVHDDIPEAWRVYPVAPDLGLAAWIADLGTRLAQCGAPPERVALHRLFNVRAFLMAARQAAAHATHTHLEQVVPAVVTGVEASTPGVYLVDGTYAPLTQISGWMVRRSPTRACA